MATVKFHRDDPRTSKSCPGTKVSKEWFLNLVENFHDEDSEVVAPDAPIKLLTVEQRLDRLEKHTGIT